jgi:hypothetical protein
MKMEKGSAALRRAIVSFLWENDNPIKTQRPPGHDTQVVISYSFKQTKHRDISISVNEEPSRGRKTTAATADQRKVNAMIARFIRKRSDVIMSKCPPGHALVVKVAYEFVPAYTEIRVWVDYHDRICGGTMEQWLAQQKKIKLAPSNEPFTDEHFKALLALRLTKQDRRLVEYFAGNGNQPTPLRKLRTVCPRAPKRIASINKICFVQGLWLQCRQTHPAHDGEPGTFQFVVMQAVRRNPRTDHRDQNLALRDLYQD